MKKVTATLQTVRRKRNEFSSKNEKFGKAKVARIFPGEISDEAA